METVEYKIMGIMDIYKHEGGDCSNSGISSRFDRVFVCSAFSADAPENGVVIVEDICCGERRTRAIPANKDGWPMFGGCFVYTSNGTVPYSGRPINLHDRFE